VKYLFSIIGFFLLIVLSCQKKVTNTTYSNVEPPTSKYGCVPPITDAEWYKTDNIAPLLEGFDAVNYPITTKNKLVQRYFNQGMTLAYGFNHAEAARSFYYATKLDPTCAMAFWGYAYVLGPNYNAGMEDEIWASEGDYSTCIVLLKEAVVIEDGLNYNEPPDWFFSVRHHLGAVQNKLNCIMMLLLLTMKI